MVTRLLESIVNEKLFTGKALIILGPRQVGKSTLLAMLESRTSEKALILNCDSNDIRKQLTEPGIAVLRRLVGKHRLVMIDEAQRVLNIGLTLKIVIDQLPDVQLIVTGSSALDLSNMVNEPLTGRKFEYLLFPLSIKELTDHYGYVETSRRLNNLIVFGSYPDVVNNPGAEPEILNNLVSSYLFKDVFMYQDIRKPEFIDRLLEAVALQLASEVSYNELAQVLGTDSHTVQRYLSLLEKAFIIFRLRSFSRNARNELKKSRKIYFYDNGVRNAILSNFSPLETRTDIGALWENYFISERLKYLHYNKIYARRYFWRTTQQQEVDYIEDHDGKLKAFELKWNPVRKYKFPLTFTRNYPEADCNVITPENIYDFLGI
ncbi:MAG: ATP-binding protein [Marinilabiliales bacterium]|nr:MAG: ATP-binding protein [Marinilabiliales bacterium]